jgi:HK97 family phage major capsid protein
MTELKEVCEKLQTDWAEFKKTNTTMLESKAEGKSVKDLEEKLTKLNDSLDKGSAKLTEIEASIKRSLAQNAGSGNSEEINEKVLRKAFRQWMKKGSDQNGNGALADAVNAVFNGDAKLKEAYFESHPEIKSLAVNTDTDGGYLVHADMNGRIIKRIFETSPIRQYAAVASISTDALEGMTDGDQVGYGWVSEKASRPQTATSKLGTWRIDTHEMYAEPAATQKVLDDAAFDIEGWLTGKIGDRFARVENNAFVLGTGDGQPTGFLTANTISDAAGASATYDNYIADKKIGYIPTGVADGFAPIPDTGDAAQGNPLIDAIYALKTEYRNRPGCAWAMHRVTMGACRKLQDAFGNYIWSPGFNGQPATLLQYPVAEFNDMPILGATNKFAIAFANWKEFYQVVDRIGIRILRDPYTAKGFVLFYATKRVGGKPLNFEAAKFIKFATT